MTRFPLFLTMLGAILAVASAGALRAQVEPPLSGSQMGSERWIVWLKDRGFNLRARLRAIRNEPNVTTRRNLLAQLEQAVLTDQQVFANLVMNAGGVVEKQYWVLSALAVEIPATFVPVLNAHPRVRRMVPVRARHVADAAVGDAAAPATSPAPALTPPIFQSTDANNHCVGRARSILTTYTNAQVASGEGAVVGFFDTGIDADANGGTAGVQHHPSFTTDPTNTTTRILAHMRAGTIDCNNLLVPGTFGPLVPGAAYGYRASDDSTSALHGTAMAGIAVGRANSGNPSVGEGHAPAASIVDVSVTVPPPADLFPPYNQGNEYRNRWTTNDATMLTAIQQLRAFLLEQNMPVHVLNISFDGWADPLDPVSSAFDEMAVVDDVLLVTSCGNSPDETFLSNGFYNGLAVGSVHTRVDPSGWSQPFVIMRETSRGPLSSNWQRYFPDVSATGAGFGTDYTASVFSSSGWPIVNQNWANVQLKMPMLDLSDTAALAGTPGGPSGEPFGSPVPPGSVRYARGTSEAAAQVSGAAALYRAARLFLVPGGATAQETRAAILISTIGGAQGDYPVTPGDAPGHAQTAYSSRNTVGVGYVRDDLLAEFAVRSAANPPPIKAMHQSVQLSAEGGTLVENIPYVGLTPGKRYVVATCWPRLVDSDSGVDLANIDLTVRSNSSIARSWSTANSYERVAFILPANETSVDIEVELKGTPPPGPVTVDVVAREFDPDRDPTTPTTVEPMPMVAASGFYENLSPGVGCVGPARPLEPFRTVPAAYSRAYGSAMASGLLLKNYDVAPWGSGLHVVLRDTQVGAATTIGGLAFRTWRPFGMNPGPGLKVMTLRLGTNTAGPVNQQELTIGTTTNATNVISGHAGGVPFGPASNVDLNWVPFGFDEFPLVVPFDVPFVYSGGNLHIWISFSGEIRVDAAGDWPSPEYGIAYQQLGGLVFLIGSCPVLALLPAQPAPPLPNLTPRLRIFGEPLLGAGLEVQVIHGPANMNVVLNIGQWLPNYVPGLCTEHIVTVNSIVGMLNDYGMARWAYPLPTDMASLHLDIAMQAVVLDGQGNPILRTNALRAVLGGGL